MENPRHELTHKGPLEHHEGPLTLHRKEPMTDPYTALAQIVADMNNAQHRADADRQARNTLITQLLAEGHPYKDVGEAAGLSRFRLNQIRRETSTQ